VKGKEDHVKSAEPTADRQRDHTQTERDERGEAQGGDADERRDANCITPFWIEHFNVSDVSMM
jgi:hypothetical protein